MNRIACLLFVLGMAVATTARAQMPILEPIEAKLTSQTKKVDRDRTSTGSVRESLEVVVTADLRNTSSKDPLDPIHLRLIPFFIPAGQTTSAKGQTPGPVQTRDYLRLAPNENLTVKFDPAPFENGVRVVPLIGGPYGATTGTTKQPYGTEYAGAALEIYLGSRLVTVQIQGPSQVRQAYEKWTATQADNAPATSSP